LIGPRTIATKQNCRKHYNCFHTKIYQYVLITSHTPEVYQATAMNKSKAAIGLVVAGTVLVVFGTVLVFVGPIIIDDHIVKTETVALLTAGGPLPPSTNQVRVCGCHPRISTCKRPLRNLLPDILVRLSWSRSSTPQRSRIHKQNITFHPNNTVSYLEYRKYFFEPGMSAGNESDVVTVPNMLVLVAAVMMENMPFAVRLVASEFFKLFKEGAFLTKSVGELMWGYDSKLADFLKKWFPGYLPFGNLGLFSKLNTTNNGLFTVHTGNDDIQLIDKVNSWNGLTKLTNWKTPQCNMINGTAGQM
ncbi:hypothetical protein DPEC_G00322850, partial [Dallia pectoralis]